MFSLHFINPRLCIDPHSIERPRKAAQYSGHGNSTLFFRKCNCTLQDLLKTKTGARVSSFCAGHLQKT